MKNNIRTLLFDIETTNLRADFGYVICIGYKWLGEKETHCIRIDDSPGYRKDQSNDRWVLEQFRKVLEEADIIIGHYSTRFDLPFLNARCLWHGLQPMPRTKHIDTWRISRDNLAISSNRLASIANLLDIGEKTTLQGRIWVKAMSGDKASIDYIVKHCIVDVKVLERAYKKLMPLRGDNPKVGFDRQCPTCGSENTQSRGLERTVKQQQHKMSCGNCGHWFRVPVKKGEKV